MAYRYDTVTLIELVELRPSLWDKTHHEYKDRMAKKEAWDEIFHYLEERYDDLSKEKRKEVGDKIMNKWINIKDAYLKSVKKTEQGSKPYLYGKHINFLLKGRKRDNNNFENIEIHSDVQDTSNSAEVFVTPDLSTNDETYEDIIKSSKQKRATMSTRQFDDIDMQIVEELQQKQLDNPQSLLFMSDDDKLFQSFVPYIKDMTESEKIDLQLDILHSIKKIKKNRPQKHPAFCMKSHPQPSSSGEHRSLKTDDYDDDL